MPLQFRRGTNAERTTITPAVGEPIWTTNTNRLYVGDGVTAGGVPVEIPLPSTGTFTSLTVTNLFFTGDPVGVSQTTAWTGTVAWNSINSKPNNGLYTTSSVTFSNVTATNRVFVNPTGSSTYEAPHSTGYTFWGINDGADAARLVLDQYGTGDSVITGRGARGTPAAPTAAQNGDTLLRLAGTGFGTTQFPSTSSGFIDVIAVENMTDGAHGTKITLNTTNAGTNNTNVSLSVASDGAIFTAPQVSATESVITVDQTGGTSYPAPPQSGQVFWGISNNASGTRVLLDNFDSTSPFPLFGGRAGRGTAAAPTAVQNGDTLASFRGNGYGTTGFQTTSSGILQFNAIENFTDTARGTSLTVSLAPLGQRDATPMATIRSDGMFLYTTATTANGMLTINGPYPNAVAEGSLDDNLVWGIAKPGRVGRISVDAFGVDTPSQKTAATFSGRRAQGTADSPTATLAGDTLVRINGFGHNGTTFQNTSSAGINLLALENFSGTAAGGKIEFFAQQLGNIGTQTQTVMATMTVADGFTADQVNVNNLTINNAGEILTSNASDIDLFTNQGGAGSVEVWLKHGNSVDITTNAGAEVWSFDNAGNLTFPDGTVQPTAWTGTVIWNNITDKPNNGLYTTSTVQFAGITDTGPLSVTGFSALNGGARLSAATVTNSLSVGTTLDANGFTTLDGGARISAATVTNSLAVGTSLAVTGFSSLNGGATASALTITNAASIGTSLDVTGLSSLNGGATISNATITNAATVGTSLAVTGLSSLNGGATISAATVTNNLTAGATTLQSLSVTTGTVLSRASIGGYPLNAAGTASWFLSQGLSPVMPVTNWTAGVTPVIALRGYGQNTPGATAASVPNPGLRIESSRGTNSAPTAMQANQNLGGILVGGYDGANWPSDQSTAYNFMGWFSTENMTNDGSTATYQAGSGFGIFVQPAWTRPGINATRQRFIFTNWATTSSTGPTQLNLTLGSGIDSTTAPTMTMVDGTTYTGYGRTNMAIMNTIPAVFGVPNTDTAPDNNTLTGTNFINIISGRRSGTSGRRNQVQINDSLGGLAWRSQSANNSTGNGNLNANILATALETQTAGAQGARLTISTVNTGTTSFGTRMSIDNRLMTYNADQHQFSNGGSTNIPLTFTTSTWNSSIDSMSFGNTAGTVTMLQMNTTDNTYNNTNHVFKDRSGLTTALTMTTSTAAFNSGLQITTYARTYGEFAYTGTTITVAAQDTVYAFPIDTTNQSAGVTTSNTSRINFTRVGGGAFKIIMSLQAAMSTNSVGQFDFWLRKNGNDVPNSKTQVDLLKDQKSVIAMDWMVTPAVNDYYEIVYASGSANYANITFPTIAATTSPYVSPLAPALIVNVIPVGA